MSSFKDFIEKNKDNLKSKSMKMGGYSFGITLLLIAVLVLVNIAVSALPSTWTHYDISSMRLYSVTSSTKSVVQNLDKDVTIYWITQAGEEDAVIEKLLDVYKAQSSHLSVDKKNPDVYPTFASRYTDSAVQNNSLVVECGDRYRYIPYDSIYIADTSDYYTTGSVAYEFDGEGMITTAINYVISDDLPKIYILGGHGEAEISDDFLLAIERQNYETEDLSLLTVDEIPEDARAILINAPTSDISSKEATMLRNYLSSGGKLIVLSGPQDTEKLTNLHSIAEYYGIGFYDGVVIEGNRGYYAYGKPYALLPDFGDSEITSELSENNNNVLLFITQGLDTSAVKTGYVVTSLLRTSDDAFSKIAGYNLDTYEIEDGDIGGPFSLGVTIEDTKTDAAIVWISTDALIDDTVNEYSSGANCDFFMNCVSWAIGENESIAIRSKSLDYNYLTISSSQATFIKICIIGIIPVLYLLYGIDEVIRRKKRV